MSTRLIIIIIRFAALGNDLSADETEEKSRLISQILELQNTLDGTLRLHGSIGRCLKPFQIDHFLC